MIYTYFWQVDDLTITLILILTITLNKGSGKSFDSNFCLNCILKWMKTCEVSMGVSLKTVIFLSQTIFSCVGDSLAHKMSLYVES